MGFFTKDLEKRLDESLDKVDKVTDLVTKLLTEGIKFRLKIAGQDVPVVLIVEPDDE